jgi:hypothetical protein
MIFVRTHQGGEALGRIASSAVRRSSMKILD